MNKPRFFRFSKDRRLREVIAESIMKIVSFFSLAAIFLILAFVLRESLPMFSKTVTENIKVASSAEQETYGETAGQTYDAASESSKREATDQKPGFRELTGTNWHPVSLSPRFGLMPLIIGSLKVTLISLLIAGPLGILAALFTSSFAPRWARELLKPVIEILAGFPSVVIGFFALVVLASLLQNIFGYEYRLNAFVGGVALSLAVIPIIFTVAEDALSAVPTSLIEASLAIGATKWQTALYVLLPGAAPGILAAVILGFGRAFGETMIVLMATGNAVLLSAHPFEPVRTLSATIGAEMAEVVFGDIHYNVLFFIGSLLFVFSFTLNAIAELYVRQRMLKKFGRS